MSKEPIALAVPDISAFARNLSAGLSAQETPPSHLSLLNLCAKAAGFRNYQHLRAAQAGLEKARLAMPEPEADLRFVTLVARQFTADGRWSRWPSKRRQQEAGLWVIWAHLPAGRVMQEPEINDRLRALHSFSDPAILRRSLVGMALLQRNRDGSDYRRLESPPPADARMLIRLMTQRRTAHS